MKIEYITDIRNTDRSHGKTKHTVKFVVEVNGVKYDVERKKEEYGCMKGKNFLAFRGANVFQDFGFTTKSSYDPLHLSEVVLAIEIAKAIVESVGINGAYED